MEKMTLHAALGELKKLDQRINKAIFNAMFIGAKKKTADFVLNTTFAVEDFNKDCNAELQSIEALIERRGKIKSAIVISNATTEVIVGKLKMTVAEAIEFKTSIDYQKELLKKMKLKRDTIVAQVTRMNEKVEEQLDAQLSAFTSNSKDKATSLSNLTGFIEEYRQQNLYDIIDPLKLTDKINTLEESILDFETNVDVALSNSNALTAIEI